MVNQARHKVRCGKESGLHGEALTILLLFGLTDPSNGACSRSVAWQMQTRANCGPWRREPKGRVRLFLVAARGVSVGARPSGSQER